MLKEKINTGQDTTNLQDNLAAIENRVAMLESQRDVDLMFFNYTNLGIYSITIKRSSFQRKKSRNLLRFFFHNSNEVSLNLSNSTCVSLTINMVQFDFLVC